VQTTLVGHETAPVPQILPNEPEGIGQEQSLPLTQRIAQARQQFNQFKIKTPDPTVERDLKHGWLVPVLLRLDEWLWQRWDYWYECCCNVGRLPNTPIPRIEFIGSPHSGTRKMLEASLNCIPGHGSWQTWGNWQYVNYLFDWLLFAFGHPGHKDLPPEPSGCAGASNRLYQVMNLDALLLWPYDYWGDILGDNFYGRKQGFYATPHSICEVMTRMVFDEAKDYRRETMMDPCIGTGRFPLYASNYTLRLYGMDIDPVLCKAALVNGYLYAPWMVRPIPWLDPELTQVGQEDPGKTMDATEPNRATLEASEGFDSQAARDFEAGDTPAPSLAAHLSDRMVDTAPPHAQDYLAETEHDPQEQPRVAPILKRRRKSVPGSQGLVGQGCLFPELPD